MQPDMYWQRMREVSAAVSDCMEPWQFIPFVQRRSCRQLLRASLVRSAYEAAGGHGWKEVVPLATIIENLMSCMYLTNEIVDRKGGTIDVATHREHEQILRSAMLADAERLLGAAAASTLQHAINNTYRGLALDIKRLTWKVLNNPLEQLESWYQRRCRLLNADLIAAGCSLAVQVAGGRPEIARALTTFSQHYGAALQMTNDIGDFTPIKADAWADLRNGRLTAPIFYGWHTGSHTCRTAICTCRDAYSPDAAMQLTSLLREEGHFTRVRALAHAHGQSARAALRTTLTPAQRAPLATACVLFIHNRLYDALSI